MYKLEKSVENTRIGKTLNFHVVPENYQGLNLKKKTLYAAIHSYESDKVFDAYNDDGVLQPTNVANVLIENIDPNNIEKSVADYMDENLSKIVAL